jgi:hypothetical protein
MITRAPCSGPRAAGLGPALLVALLLPWGALSAQDGGAPPGGVEGQPPAADAGGDAAADEAAMAVVETIDKAITERDPVKIKPVFTTLDEQWARLSPKTVKRVEKSLSAMFAKLKPRDAQVDVDTMGDQARNGRYEPDEDNPPPETDNQRQDVLDCYHAAIGLLYDKPEGAAMLLPVLKLPHVKSWPEVQVLVLEGLGYREDQALAKDFEAYLRHESTTVASAAAASLGRLREKPMDVRRQAVSSIVDAFTAAQKAADKEAAKAGEDDDRPARRYLSSITVSFRDALTSLTRQNFDKPAEWRTWLDAHGKDASW